MNRKKGLTNEEAYKILFEDIPDDTDTEVEDTSDDERNVATEEQDNFSSVFDKLLAAEEATVDQTVTQPPSGNDECLLQDPEGNTSCNENDSMQTKTSPPKDAPRGWKKKTVTTEIPEYLHPEGPIEDHFAGCNTPTDVFIKMCGPLIDHVCYQSNLYATQKMKTLAMTEKEFLAFIGINFVMGYVQLPSWKHYWSTSNDLGVHIISSAMPRKRFDDILTHLHCNDNTSKPVDCKNKLYKIQPLIDIFNSQFSSLYNVTQSVSVDESMIRFKGRSSLKQYNPKKPIKRGYKLWCIADQNGYIVGFRVYQGREEIVDEELSKYGLGERVVLTLTKPFWGTGLQVYFDNYFTSVALLEKLKVEKIIACGTIRSNRKNIPQLANDSSLSRGESDFRVSNMGITVFKWKDNRAVLLASNFHGSEETIVKRRKQDGSKVDISCPRVVKDYNEKMGGVDKADQLRALYCVNRKSRKWWQRIFWGVLDICFVNSFVIHNLMFPKMTVLQEISSTRLDCPNTNRKAEGCLKEAEFFYSPSPP